jgi:hypothetical protein
MKLNKTIMILLFLFVQIIFVNFALSKEAEVIYVDIAGQSLNDIAEIKSACDLFGVRFKTHHVRTTNNTEILKSIRELHDKEVLILTARVMKYFNKDMVSPFGQRERKTKILISGINSETDIEDLKIWSGNRIKNFRRFDLPRIGASISVVKNDQISKELGGLEYPVSGSGSGMINGFELADPAGAVSLVDVVNELGKPVCPLFLKTESAKRSVYFLASWEKVMSAEANSLLKIMPILMFLKCSFGDRCWHGINDYANLTIDDPWLTDPYGYMGFKELCREAKKAPFHATIAFIPYNYQKSHNDVVEIFKQCPENLSISIHGNNHDFSEFRSGSDGRLADKNLNTIHPDEKSILHALYRMDTFSRKTGLSYDRVMIFPRGTFTKESLRLLKKHDFLMTVNSTRPFNAGHITNIIDQMRGITFEFENFPMALRSGISDWKNDKRGGSVEKSWIQMRLFLDLPVLLYTHQGFFKDGADAFNSIAGSINQLQPDVVWSGLGAIAKKMYLQKKIDDRDIEIMAFSSDLVIENNYHFTMKYVVRKQEDFLIPIQSVEVDGITHEYLQDGKNIRIEFFIEPGREKNIRILYHSDYQVGSFTFSDNGVQIKLIRALSDVRDLYLSKLPFGDKMVMIFYWVGGVKGFGIGVIGATGIIFILWILYRRNNRRKMP